MTDFFESDEFWITCHKLSLDAEHLKDWDKEALVKCLFVTAENREWWREQYYLMRGLAKIDGDSFAQVGCKHNEWARLVLGQVRHLRKCMECRLVEHASTPEAKDEK